MPRWRPRSMCSGPRASPPRRRRTWCRQWGMAGGVSTTPSATSRQPYLEAFASKNAPSRLLGHRQPVPVSRSPSAKAEPAISLNLASFRKPEGGSPHEAPFPTNIRTHQTQSDARLFNLLIILAESLRVSHPRFPRVKSRPPATPERIDDPRGWTGTARSARP